MLRKKLTTKLFRGVYQYKIVLVCSGSGFFRNKEFSAIIDELNSSNTIPHRSSSIKTLADKIYAISLASELSKMADIDLRVESPWISVYSNNKKDVEKLAKLDASRVKYICEPAGNNLTSDTIIMPKINYDFRVTLGKTTQPNPAFIEWADKSTKCKLTKSCIRDLQKPRSWGGTHFYISGDNNLLVAKMHLGGSIAKVEQIVKN